MSLIDIKPTTKTPAIKGDSSLGTLLISGKSLPENARLFYEPLMQWFVNLNENTPKEIKVTLDLEYYNTSSSSILFRILDSLKKLNKKTSVQITWHYEADDLEMQEIGQDFQKVMGGFFNLKAKTNHAEAN